jgi:hypothetical protein
MVTACNGGESRLERIANGIAARAAFQAAVDAKTGAAARIFAALEGFLMCSGSRRAAERRYLRPINQNVVRR